MDQFSAKTKIKFIQSESIFTFPIKFRIYCAKDHKLQSWNGPKKKYIENEQIDSWKSFAFKNLWHWPAKLQKIIKCFAYKITLFHFLHTNNNFREIPLIQFNILYFSAVHSFSQFFFWNLYQFTFIPIRQLFHFTQNFCLKFFLIFSVGAENIAQKSGDSKRSNPFVVLVAW